jgi:acetyltransferase
MTGFFDFFFNPRGIAIVGASSDPLKLGYAVARNLIESGYHGKVHLVNPKNGSLFNLPMHQTIASVPDPVDLAVLIVPASAACQALREVGQRGIHAAIITSGGFRETGLIGAQLEADLLVVCKEFDIRLIGPNCVGLIDTHLPIDTTFLPQPMPIRGDIAFLSQSGAFCAAMIDWSRGQGFGFSQIISVGNQADLTETDLLPVVASAQHTKTICMYLENISNGQKFMDATKGITPIKPIVVLKVGQTASGQKAASSHTGALAGSETALNAAFEKSGVLRAATAEQLFDWAQALSACPLPSGKNVAILTSAGGPGVIASDAIESAGLSLAVCCPQTLTRLEGILPPAASTHNPVDMLASASPQQYAECLEILLADPAVDSVLIITLPPPNHRAEDIADALIPLIQMSQKPVLIAQMGAYLTATAHDHFVHAGIPVYPFPERAASALGILSRRADFLSSDLGDHNRDFSAVQATGLSADQLVAAYEIATSPLVLATSSQEAASLAAEMPFPLVAKISSPHILHKSDIGGVILNLNSLEEVTNAYTILMDRARSARPDASLDGITLQSQIPDGQDVIIGAVCDPQFGPLMMFGSGGVEAEGLNDVAFALAPLNRIEAEKMLQQTWAGRKLAGFRNIAPADKSAVIEALIRLSWLAIDHPEIAEIEINPLRALKQGAVALDVRMKLA